MADEELSPAQAEAVRRLLEEARHDEPMPDVVARHLDDVVAGLAADRANATAAEPPDTTVVPFRQRRWPKVLVAAAAVSALGLGVTQVLSGMGTSGSDDSGGAAADRAVVDGGVDDGDDGRDFAEGPVAEPAPADAPREQEPRNARSKWLNRYVKVNGVVAGEALSELSSTIDRLEPLPRRQLRGALRLLADSMYRAAHKDAATDLLDGVVVDTGSAYDAAIAPRACGPIYTVVGGVATYAKYHQKLALVLFHPEINGAQLVELYVCSGKAPRRSVERVTLWDGE